MPQTTAHKTSDTTSTYRTSELASICRRLNVDSILLISHAKDNYAEAQQSIIDYLTTENIVIFSEELTKGSITEESILQMVSFIQDRNINGVIGCGGVIATTTAKLISAFARSDFELLQEFGLQNRPSQKLPLIQVPIGTGTGLEVTPYAVVEDKLSSTYFMRHTAFQPDAIIIDPENTHNRITKKDISQTAIYALILAIESHTKLGNACHAADMYSSQAIKLLASNIENVHPLSVNHLQTILEGCYLSGISTTVRSNPFSHVLSYPLEVINDDFGLPYIIMSVSLMKTFMTYNTTRMADVYDIILSTTPHYRPRLLAPTKKKRQALSTILWIEKIVEDLKFPLSLRALGVQKSALEKISNDSSRTRINGRPIHKKLTKKLAYSIYSSAF